MKKFLILLIIVILASGYFGYKKFYKKEGLKILEKTKVEKGNLNAVLVETGIIKPQVGAEVKVGARASGTIINMNVKIGDQVKQGQLIAKIDDREILQAIDKSKSAYEYAKISYDRQQKLIKTDSTTKDALDKAKNALDETLSDLEQQTIKLSYTKIYAPIDGFVSEITAQEGEMIITGLQVANLITIIDPTRLEMWIYVDETNIGSVKNGMRVEYSVDTFQDKTFNGTIHKIYPQPEIKDNVVYYMAIVDISKEDAAFLKTSMTTRVKIIYEEKNGILLVPNEAVKFDNGKNIAYKVLPGDKIKPVDVIIGIRGEEKTEVVSGVNLGDTIATKLILPANASSETLK